MKDGEDNDVSQIGSEQENTITSDAASNHAPEDSTSPQTQSGLDRNKGTFLLLYRLIDKHIRKDFYIIIKT